MSYQPYTMPPPMPIDPTAVTGRRIGAWFIDAIIFLVLSNVLGLVFGSGGNVTSRDFAGDSAAAKAFCDGWNAAHDGLCFNSGGSVTAVESANTGIWIFLGLFVAFVVFQGLLGGSLGKLVVGLRIVKADGTQAGVGASLVRTLLWVVDAITCAMPIVGGILILSTQGHRRVGDMAAGTYVVSASQVGQPVILPGQPGWGGYPQGPYQPGPYPQPGQGYGQPGAPVVLPPGMTPWAPSTPNDPTNMPGTAGLPPSSPPAQDSYEADKPIWDETRHAYIQYDSGRSAWLEFDDATKEWKPIST